MQLGASADFAPARLLWHGLRPKIRSAPKFLAAHARTQLGKHHELHTANRELVCCR